MLYITGLSAAVLATLAVMLSLKIVGIRRKEKIVIGDGGNELLLRAQRSHSNLLEYAPITLMLLACAEINGVHRLLLALLAIAFIVGRVMHPVGMRDSESPFQMRVMGMQLTLVSMLALSAVNVLWLFWLMVT